MIGVMVAVVFLLSGFYFIGIQANAQVASFLPDWITDKVDRLVELERQDAMKEVETFGAVSSPNIPSPYLEFGGITNWNARANSFNSASSTLKALESPKATSTLASLDLYVENASSSGMYIEITKAPAQPVTPGQPNATTTLISQYYVGGNTKTMIHASTTPLTNTEESNIQFDAQVSSSTSATSHTNDYIVIKAYGDGAQWNDTQGFTPTGHVQANWREN